MTYSEMLNKLCAFYGKKVSPEFVTQYNKVMSRYSPSILKQVYEHTTEHDEKFTSLSMLRNFADYFQEQEEQKRHAAQRKAEAEPIRVDNNPFAKSVLETVKAAMSGQITRMGFLACMEEMRMQTGELRSFYKAKGLDINKPCGHGIERIQE